LILAVFIFVISVTQLVLSVRVCVCAHARFYYGLDISGMFLGVQHSIWRDTKL